MNWTDIISGVGGGSFTGILTYVGARRVAKQSDRAADQQARLDARRVGIDEFREFKETYRQEREEDHLEIQRLRGLLVSAVSHITQLRATMFQHRVDPPPIPSDLVRIGLGGFDNTESR